jgi:F0F1-type ATP synthase epsilon subunit
MKDKALFVTIRSRTGIIYEGNAISLTSYNDKGKFDILPEHANFISLIQKKLILREKDKTKQEIDIGNGVLRVMSNQVDVYLGIKR